MRQYAVIIFIALHLISSTLYAVNASAKQHHINSNTHKCSFNHNKQSHEHFHTHNGSNHSHNHTHKNMNVLDLLVQSNNTKHYTVSYSKETFVEMTYSISNPSLKSLFRPPIV